MRDDEKRIRVDLTIGDRRICHTTIIDDAYTYLQFKNIARLCLENIFRNMDITSGCEGNVPIDDVLSAIDRYDHMYDSEDKKNA